MSTEIEKAYLAGVMDADGCIGIYCSTSGDGYRHHILQVILKQVRDEAIRLMADLYGGSVHRNKPRGNSRPQWAITLRSNKAHALLTDIAPYMRIKRDQALLGIEYQDSVQNIPIQMGSGKSRGRQVLPESVWQRREEMRVRMFALNSGTLGVTPLRAVAETESRGARPIRVKRQSELAGNRKKLAEMTSSTKPGG